MLIRLRDFLEQNGILYENQHGFVKNKSTTTAMFNLVNDIVKQLDTKNHSAGLFFDLSKAFDLVDHGLLLEKIGDVGVRGVALDWIASYLRGRRQYVEIQAVNVAGQVRFYTSEEATILRGVPQGSVLGPTLFLLFINNLSSCTSDSKLSLFADDTSLSISSSAFEDLEQVAFMEANKLLQWFDDNLLAVNSDKTQLIQFSLSKRSNLGFPLLLDETTIFPTNSIKFLGLMLDEQLSFRTHIEHVSRKLSSGIFVLRSLQKVVNREVLLAAYYGLIYPHLSYAVPIWGHENRHTLALFKLQKWAVRTVFSLNKRQSCKDTFRESQILTLPSIYLLETLTFVRQNFSEFNFSIQTGYSLRNSNKLSIPKHSTSFYKNHLCYNGITLFNHLPLSLRLESNLSKFRKTLKNHLINLACYSVREFLTGNV